MLGGILMRTRNKIEEKIKRKEAEVQELELKMREAKAYVQALQDTLKMLPREIRGGDIGDTLRSGSNIHKTYELLKKAGKPLHINKILEGIGKPTLKKDKTSLAGSLGWYVRRREIFYRPSPNTFGLLEMEESQEPPDDFGLDHGSIPEDDVPF